MIAIDAQNLSREFRIHAKGQSAWRLLLNPRYESVKAVTDINLTVQQGEIVGYIGPNGAGKSTTIKMLLGVLYPTDGKVNILGRDPFRERMANNQDVGVIWGQRNYLTWDLPVRDSMERFRYIYQVSRADFDERLKLCSQFYDVEPLLHKHARQLSLGQRMICNLINIVLHRPRLLYLDEPTIGLDVLVKHQVRMFLRRLNREWGTTILLTTHDLSDIEDLCPRIVVIDKGLKVLDDNLDRVRDRLGGGVKITFQFHPESTLDPQALTGLSEEFPGVTVHTQPGPRLVTQVPRSSVAPIAVIRWVANRLAPIHLDMQDSPIEEVVKRLYLGEGRSGT